MNQIAGKEVTHSRKTQQPNQYNPDILPKVSLSLLQLRRWNVPSEFAFKNAIV
jgi:hypothetical protein